MYYIFYAIITIVWLFDIFNFKFMEILDTKYPINFWAWVIIWLVVGGIFEEYQNGRKYK